MWKLAQEGKLEWEFYLPRSDAFKEIDDEQLDWQNKQFQKPDEFDLNRFMSDVAHFEERRNELNQADAGVYGHIANRIAHLKKRYEGEHPCLDAKLNRAWYVVDCAITNFFFRLLWIDFEGKRVSAFRRHITTVSGKKKITLLEKDLRVGIDLLEKEFAVVSPLLQVYDAWCFSRKRTKIVQFASLGAAIIMWLHRNTSSETKEESVGVCSRQVKRPWLKAGKTTQETWAKQFADEVENLVFVGMLKFRKGRRKGKK